MLPVVLLMLVLIGLLAASFAFHVNARLNATQVTINRVQTRLAAESCVEKIKLVLRDDRMNINRWYDNIEEFHRIIVWKPGGDETIWDTNEEYEDDPNERLVYRCSLVGDDFTDDEEAIRIGVTDEGAKLNINTATRDQLLVLMRQAIGDREDLDPSDVVDAILDWRDEDSDPRTEEGDTEGLYYDGLVRPYKVKNGPFDTIEELLRVKGMDGRVLYGEDYDRNGLLSPNEDDGDERFPPDNTDGFLNLGLLPYVTVHSREFNVSNDERDRINIYDSDQRSLREKLSEAFEDDSAKVAFVLRAAQQQQNNGGGNGNNNGGGSGNSGGGRNRNRGQTDNAAGNGGGDAGGAATDEQGRPMTQRPTDKSDRLAQQRPDRSGAPAAGGGDPPASGADAGTTTADDGTTDAGMAGSAQDSTGADGTNAADGDEDDGTAGSGGGGGGQSGRAITTPAQLLKDLAGGGGSPFTVQDLPVLMDRLSVNPPRGETPGVINVNTAPAPVLRCLPGVSEEQVTAILNIRGGLDSEAKATTAWLVIEEVMDLDEYIALAPQITARGTQFTVESLGYADFMGMVTRLQVILEMRGPLVQAMYHRDLTHLGGRYPIREQDLETIRGER